MSTPRLGCCSSTSRRVIGWLDGTASIAEDDPTLETYLEDQFVVRVRPRAVYPNYPNCPRYLHRYQLVERSRFVPHTETLTPVPEWKRSDWAADVLPPAGLTRA